MGFGILLLSAVAGYLVFERASERKGRVRKVGQAVGVAVIILSFLGVVCQVACGLCGSSCPLGGYWGKRAWKGGQCPISASSAVPAPAK